MIFRVQDTSEKRVEVGVAGKIYAWPGGWQSFCPLLFCPSLSLIDKVNVLHPFW